MTARILVVRNDTTDPIGRFGGWLTDAGAELVHTDADAGDAVPTAVPDGIDGVIALGGEMSATSDEVAPWLPAERALLRDAVERGVPTLGICLGGQLLTVALGGVVDPTPTPEIGLTELSWLSAARDDALLGGLEEGAPVAQYHLDRMRDLPVGAVVLASTPRCEHQAWRLGQHTWAVQFHPEVDADRVVSWMDTDTDTVRMHGFDAEQLRAELHRRDSELARTWQVVAARFAAIAAARA